ncbi:MAG: hypothetical protein Q4F67_08405 [Propionibacteriaceae bacterium]|nr:hypothetical protein [Propionibacteriaceae bacterium]
MSDLSSMLVPLTGGQFPGWPASAEAPTVVQELLVLVGIPFAIMAIVGLLAFSGTLIRRGRGSDVRVSEPLWLGQTSTDKQVATSTARRALTEGGQAQETTTGGASVRW